MMRDYSKISPQFWLSKMGRKLRDIGPEAQLIALYLMSSPHSTMFGIYYLPYLLIAHETGLTETQVHNVMGQLIKLNFCSYDEQFEYVWVHEMARDQMAPQLKSNDNRVKTVNKYLAQLPQLSFINAFYAAYDKDFHLTPLSQVHTSPIKETPKISSFMQDEVVNEDTKLEAFCNEEPTTCYRPPDILDMLDMMDQEDHTPGIVKQTTDEIDQSTSVDANKINLANPGSNQLPPGVHASSLITVQCVFNKWKQLSGQVEAELQLDLYTAINQALITVLYA